MSDVLGALAVGAALLGYIDYFRGIYAGTVKPHLLSWIVWCLTSVIVAVAQYIKGAGAGNWVIMVTAVACAWISILACRRGTKNVTRTDWCAFLAALAAVPIWLVTHDPIWSVLLVTGIDALSFFPTYRKSWQHPYEERLPLYVSSFFKYLLGLCALDAFNLTTMIYPLISTCLEAAFITMVWLRRRQL